VIQVISILGAVLILCAYAANQFGRLPTAGLAYSLLNVVGAATLAVVAAVEEQWGFLLLEGVWTLVSVAALFQLARPAAEGKRA
jgi:hypothetical protein